MRKNCIHQGDCVELLEKADPGSVDLVFADPPFNIGYKYDVYDDSRKAEEYLHWSRQWIAGIHRVLKDDGTFWLAIGDEFAAELKIEAQKIGFHCRSWVIWYYTFGVNCRNGFSRSHTHLFHFVKDKQKFTFNRVHPQVRVKSARELVYADARANPNGRLPDNTWITRPQDAPFFLSFNPTHDTWYYARVAGTFKEREGFHGCQMPEQLLARIVRVSSRPQDLVLDPFGGSGTTLSVAKKLGRKWMGFELSEDYVRYINDRLDRISVGDPIDGPEDPIQSSPSTTNGKKRKRRSFDSETQTTVTAAFQKAGDGFPADYVLCDREVNRRFISECRSQGLGGSPYIWNRYLLQLRKSGSLPNATKRSPRMSAEQMDRYGFAAEVAWRLISVDYQKTLDDILCSPEFAEEFDRLAVEFGPGDDSVTSFEYRQAALAIRKRSHSARETAAGEFSDVIQGKTSPKKFALDQSLQRLEKPGGFVLFSGPVAIFAAQSECVRERIERILENPHWAGFEPDSVRYVEHSGNFATLYALKAALAQRFEPLLNCQLLIRDSELPMLRSAS